MSNVGDILAAAIARTQALWEKHQQSVDESNREFNANIGRPWKFRISALQEANELAEEKPKEKE